MNSIQKTSLFSIILATTLLAISATNFGMEKKRHTNENHKALIERIEDLFLATGQNQKTDNYQSAMKQYRADGRNPQSWSNDGGEGPIKKKKKL